MKGKVTMRRMKDGYGCPPLYQILVDGKDLPGARVLQMGKVFLPVDDLGGLGNFGAFSTRKAAAEHVVEYRKG